MENLARMAGIGHNVPPENDYQVLANRLLEDNEEILKSSENLIDMATIFTDVQSEDEAAKITDYIKSLAVHIKKIEAARVKEKEPFLTRGKYVDQFFKQFSNKMDSAKKNSNRLLTQYARKKEEEARKEREAEERRLREEAARLAQEAEEQEQKGKTIASKESFEGAYQSELHAMHIAATKEKEVRKEASVLGESGSSASLRKTWKGELISRNELDLEALRQHLPEEALQKAINSYVLAGNRTLKGARIFEHIETVVR